jgi:hypothetical protein
LGKPHNDAALGSVMRHLPDFAAIRQRRRRVGNAKSTMNISGPQKRTSTGLLKPSIKKITFWSVVRNLRERRLNLQCRAKLLRKGECGQGEGSVGGGEGVRCEFLVPRQRAPLGRVIPTTTSVPPCSGLSRPGLETPERAARPERRPSLTAPALADLQHVWVGAKKRDSKSNKETGMKEVEEVENARK